MDEVVELENVENVCRLCLTEDEPKSSIFSVQDCAVPLATKIQACLSIQISSTDRLSTLICANCIKNIDQWHNYRETCLRSQDKLHQWLAHHTTPMVVTIKDEPVDLDFYEDNIEILSESTDADDARDNEHNMICASNDHMANHVENHIEELTDDEDDSGDKDKGPDTYTADISKESEKDISQINKDLCTVPVKIEPPDDYDTDCTIEIESVTGSELLLSPTTSVKDDRVMEADSTQKSSASTSPAKKKSRRGPHTHYRGTRTFKQKCRHCQINLHSKYSYMKHMERFHSQDLNDSGDSINIIPQDEEEMIEDLEEELVSMEKDAPLTQVQQSIISQLKTFLCYSCQQSFSDRRSTLSHIRQHMPDLRPYTCIACLTEFPDRSMYKLHCGASFECAMKIALVVPKHGQEKYFTCNMCLRPLANRKELLSHLSKHSDKQYEEMMSPTTSPPKLKLMTPTTAPSSENLQKTPIKLSIPQPYKNGDPAHNHACDLCGMIYKYKPNLLKHREICLRLQPGVRTSYRCVHCGMTFLVFKKFHTHMTVDHKRKEFTCAQCNAKFRSPSDYLAHHESHRITTVKKEQSAGKNDKAKSVQTPLKQWDSFEEEMNKMRFNTQAYSCALCGQEFPSRAELTEHRNLHLKVKIYSCVICRSMFSSAGALEIHMKDHGIEDPNERSANSSCVEYGDVNEDATDISPMDSSVVSDTDAQRNECRDCGKIFSNYPNLRRHMRNVHKNGKNFFSCSQCHKSFKSRELCDRHVQMDHKTPKTMLKCPDCPKSFVFQANLDLHLHSAHGENAENQECDICGKVFLEESSLKIHKGWHNRANSRLNTRFLTEKDPLAPSSPTRSDRPARARKSFPNPPPLKPASTMQCQVCDERFTEVNDLRKHLWDAHCARNKPEKSFSGDELQCELCTNVFPDQETLKLHMQWHKAHPILSDLRKQTFPCEVCGKHYSSKKVLWRHKRLHKATTTAMVKFQSLAKKPNNSQHLCTICRKLFSSNQSLKRHRVNVHKDLQRPQPSNRQLSTEEMKQKRIKLESEDTGKLVFNLSPSNGGKKPVTCHVCKKMFPNMSVLYKHKQMMHKQRVGKGPTKIPTTECIPLPGNNGKVTCNVCRKQFPGLPNLRQHFTLKHKNNPKVSCHMDGCNVSFSSSTPAKNQDQSNMIYSCNLCDRHVFNKAAMTSHMFTVHNTIYEAENNKSFHRETDLSTYEVGGAVNSTCPICKVKYPNNRALKIHYFKFHEATE